MSLREIEGKPERVVQPEQLGARKRAGVSLDLAERVVEHLETGRDRLAESFFLAPRDFENGREGPTISG
jgi:hypothetical protein